VTQQERQGGHLSTPPIIGRRQRSMIFLAAAGTLFSRSRTTSLKRRNSATGTLIWDKVCEKRRATSRRKAALLVGGKMSEM